MYLRSVQATAIKSAFEVLKDIITDVNLLVTEKGLYITTLDAARTALVDFKLYAENFEVYNFDETDSIVAGVNVSNMFKLLKSITNHDVIEIIINNKEFMNININNTEKKTETKFKLKLLDIDEDHLIIPESDIVCRTIMPSVDFQRICRDMHNLAQDVCISKVSNELRIECKGDFAEQSTSINTGNESSQNIAGMYSLKYMNLFTKATGMCSSVHLIQEKNGKFLILKYNVADLGELDFYLASKESI